MSIIKVFSSSVKFLIITSLLIIFCYPIGYFMLEDNVELKNSISELNITKGNGVGTYIINLDRSIERYNYVKDNIEKLGFPVNRISAIDESKMALEERNKYLDLDTYLNYVRKYPELGTIGCYLSHIKTWQNFLASDYEFALIFEDDVSFDPIFLSSTINQLIQNTSLWDINNFEIHHRGNPLILKELQNKQQLVVYLYKITHTGAYIINKSAAAKLLEKALPIKMPVDWYFTRGWEFDLKFTGIENPRIVHQTLGLSVIDYISDNSAEHNKIKNIMYVLQSHVIRFLYYLKLYISVKLS